MTNGPAFPSTAADALNNALLEAGISYVFLNSGTDYPPIIESWAKADTLGLAKPEIIISPHEMVALSAAQGYAQVSGQPQAVFVHVDVGTQNLGGALHNAYRCRIPVLIFAGLSPYTMYNEEFGSRDAYIQFLQNIPDQAAIVRNYTKHDYEIRSGINIRQNVFRALQIAKSQPAGPVYLMATREVLEQEGESGEKIKASDFQPISPSAPAPADMSVIISALRSAAKPLVITTYLGRNQAAVPLLVEFCEKFALPVVEISPNYMNFPGTNPLHLGFDSHKLITEADTILVIDCDLPWTPAIAEPGKDCRIFCIDTDPLKERIPLWHVAAELNIQADSLLALNMLNAVPDSEISAISALIEKRREIVARKHAGIFGAYLSEEESGSESISAAYLSTAINEFIDGDTIVLNETITNRELTDRIIVREKAGTLFFSGGSSLGWHGGAAIGIKLARPESEVLALTGDGTYIFSCPTAVHWMAKRYNTPFMTVIYNNGGWRAPRMITKTQHPGGYAERSGEYRTSLEPLAQLDLIAEAAGDAYATTVRKKSELTEALRAGRQAVRDGRCAVLNVIIEQD